MVAPCDAACTLEVVALMNTPRTIASARSVHEDESASGTWIHSSKESKLCIMCTDRKRNVCSVLVIGIPLLSRHLAHFASCAPTGNRTSVPYWRRSDSREREVGEGYAELRYKFGNESMFFFVFFVLQ